VDLGTTIVKAPVVDPEGRTMSEGILPVGRFCLPDGVEQDSEEIWQAICEIFRQASAGAEVRSITALVEPELSLDHLTRQWAPARSTMLPNHEAPRHEEMLERYLQPFAT
jgi:hypothetical protein